MTINNLDGISELEAEENKKIMIVAFEGWNDASEAATDTLKYLEKYLETKPVLSLDLDQYYDYQITRPNLVKEDSGDSIVTWPEVNISKAYIEEIDTEIYILKGVEPSYRWRSFIAEILNHVAKIDISLIIFLGSLLADVPHTRPIQVTATSPQSNLREIYGLEENTYEGPIGIIGVFSEIVSKIKYNSISLWAAIPHYVSQSPSPKAIVSMINQIEDIINMNFATEDIKIAAKDWEEKVNELAANDPEVFQYVKELEKAKDTLDLPTVTGDFIAREFERYLKRYGKQ